ncbi:MAG: GNAT family N-acetyltransferase [candidate division Zixibacteria bacterium]|nr:GNAT family N-acetyltransferase [candidate division Zixibacteria bacterium]
MSAYVFQTSRLIIRKASATDRDVDMYFGLWTDPKVMVYVGFPRGLSITRNQIYDRIEAEDKSEYDSLLVIALKDNDSPIGECKLGYPDSDGISETDVKLLPQYWNNGYGKEVKKGLVDYLFENTNCIAVKATPNKTNIASQKMQAAVGGKKVAEAVYKFPSEMRKFTIDVPHYIYMVYREDWLNSKRQ